MKLTLLLLAALAQERANEALLGVVAVEREAGVTVAFVLPDSPAAAAELKAGDVLVKVGRREIKRAADVDRALRRAKAGDSVAITYTREKEEQKTSAELIVRRSYKGEFLRSRKRGSTGFKAPEWYGFAWANLEKDEEPPDRANTKDKVVVIHAFQSW